jgi:hypothetical protein
LHRIAPDKSRIEAAPRAPCFIPPACLW